jgi:hypothetical protein
MYDHRNPVQLQFCDNISFPFLGSLAATASFLLFTRDAVVTVAFDF